MGCAASAGVVANHRDMQVTVTCDHDHDGDVEGDNDGNGFDVSKRARLKIFRPSLLGPPP